MQNLSESTIRIVIVEDHEFTRIGLKMGLEQVPGLSVIAESEDGREGLKTVMELKPDVVLMDIELPHVDGIEATRQIRAREAGQRVQRTPILALTANALVEDRYACFEAGMDGFLVKPLDRDKLTEALAGLMLSRHLAA